MFRGVILLIALSTLSALSVGCGPRQGLSTKETLQLVLMGKLPEASQSPTVTPTSQPVANPAVKPDILGKQDKPNRPAPTNERERTIMASQKPIERGELIPENFTQALLLGKWESSSCADKVKIEFTVDKVKFSNTWPLFYGSIRVFDRSRQSEPLVIDALLNGSFDPARGFLAVNAVSKPPPDFTHPIWEAMVLDRAPEIAQLRRKYYEERQARNLKLMFSGKANEMEQAARDYDNSRGKEIQNEIDQIHSETLAKLKTEFTPIPLIPLAFDVARDTAGKGWVGTIESDVLASCHEVHFVSKQGYSTEKLPLLTGQAALERAASKDIYTPTPIAQAYWLHIAEQYPEEKDLLLLGQVYDDQGRRETQNYVHAVQYYRAVLKKADDARAQKPLARLYAEGLGTKKDPVEAQRLNQLADKANARADKACTSPQAIVAIKSMLSDLYKPLKAELMNVRAVNVISVKKPFSCEAKSKPSGLPSAVDIGNKVYSLIPDVNYETTTTYKGGGTETTYSDNSMEKAMMGLGAMMFAASSASERRVYTDSFTVDQVDAFDYKITWSDINQRYPYPIARTIEVH